MLCVYCAFAGRFRTQETRGGPYLMWHLCVSKCKGLLGWKYIKPSLAARSTTFNLDYIKVFLNFGSLDSCLLSTHEDLAGILCSAVVFFSTRLDGPEGKPGGQTFTAGGLPCLRGLILNGLKALFLGLRSAQHAIWLKQAWLSLKKLN